MQNYFEYFSEIEERFSRRRGSVLLLSTLDWALIESWREAGVPLEAVLRGINAAFDRYEERATRAKGRLRKVNGLAWCAQAVMAAAEEMVDAAAGVAPQRRQASAEQSGFESERVAAYLLRNAERLQAASAGATGEDLSGAATRLRELAATMRGPEAMALEDLDRTLTVLEERVIDALRRAASETEMVELRAEAERELAPYRARMGAMQRKQVREQFMTKRLLERHRLPRLSLFYMGMGA